MASDIEDCGPLHDVYDAARSGNLEVVKAVWREAEPILSEMDEAAAAAVGRAVATGDTAAVRSAAAERLFGEGTPPTLDGPISRIVGRLLWAFGYLASFVLFFRAHSRKAVVRRLRWAYRTVGVTIVDAESVEGVERTTFRCPYRNIGADRWGQRHVCHDVLDRVDDGYVSFLSRHRDLDYQRPRACGASGCCYSEVSEL